MTAPSLPFLWKAAQNWGPSLAQQESAQDLLSNPTSCRSMAPEILRWARQLPESAFLSRHNTTLLVELLMPLLPWGLRQPWAHEIPVSLILDLWVNSLDKAPKESKTLHMAMATEIVRHAVSVPTAHTERAITLAQQWFCRNTQGQGAWMWDVVAEDRREHVYDAWANFGLIAQTRICRHLNNPRQSLSQFWLTTLSSSFEEMSVPNGSRVLFAMLASELTDKTKLLACKLADPRSWLDEDIQPGLRALLPSDDLLCYPELPFAVPNRGLPFAAVGSINRRLAQSYCPSLIPFFEVGVADDQWTQRNIVLSVHRMAKQSRRPLGTIELPDLSDQTS